jgi:hypothetical protein
MIILDILILLSMSKRVRDKLDQHGQEQRKRREEMDELLACARQVANDVGWSLDTAETWCEEVDVTVDKLAQHPIVTQLPQHLAKHSSPNKLDMSR